MPHLCSSTAVVLFYSAKIRISEQKNKGKSFFLCFTLTNPHLFAENCEKVLTLGKKRKVFLCFALANSYFCRIKATTMEQTTTIFLVRHGETVDNARRIMQGQTHGMLNEHGREQAEGVAERLASEEIDAVVASDLRRAIQTAEIISARHALPVTTTPLLRERDWGSFTGLYIPELKGRKWTDDIETEEALLLRARDFLLYITTTYPGKRVVAVGHGIINKAILAVYAQCPMREVQRMMNAEVRLLTASAERTASAAVATSLSARGAATAARRATAE